MKVLIRVAVGILFISLVSSCKTYQKINTSKSNAETSLEQVVYQLEQVEPNEMIKVTTLDQKKYEFEYLSHTQDTLKGILYYRLPGTSPVHSKVDTKLALNKVKTVKNKRTNYFVSIGVPIITLVGGLYIWASSDWITLSDDWYKYPSL